MMAKTHHRPPPLLLAASQPPPPLARDSTTKWGPERESVADLLAHCDPMAPRAPLHLHGFGAMSSSNVSRSLASLSTASSASGASTPSGSPSLSGTTTPCSERHAASAQVFERSIFGLRPRFSAGALRKEVSSGSPAVAQPQCYQRSALLVSPRPVGGESESIAPTIACGTPSRAINVPAAGTQQGSLAKSMSPCNSRLEILASSPELYEQLCRTTFRNTIKKEGDALSLDQACFLGEVVCVRLGIFGFDENLFHSAFWGVDEHADGHVSEAEFVRLYGAYLCLSSGCSKLRVDCSDRWSALGRLEEMEESEPTPTDSSMEMLVSRQPFRVDWSSAVTPDADIAPGCPASTGVRAVFARHKAAQTAAV